MYKILLIGQPIEKNRKGDIGSGGGYVRNMRVYLKYFQSEKFNIIPCFHTSRREYTNNILFKILRIIIDFKRFILSMIKYRPDGIHIMAQYRDAIPREVMYIFISKLFRKPILYEIKAGAFIDSYKNRSKFYKKFVSYIIKNSKIILVEGEKYIEFLLSNFDRNSYYFPNIVPDKEIPLKKSELFKNNSIKLLYAGHVTYEKGIIHLLKACKKLDGDGNNYEVSIIGKEDEIVSKKIDSLIKQLKGIKVHRYGGKDHEFILSKMSDHDVFCYPTFHSGEGHSNAINEAMMNSMVIVSTRNGFLGDILTDDSAYFVRDKNADDIYDALDNIRKNRNEASEKAKIAYDILKTKYTISRISKDINNYYSELVN